VGEEFVRLDGDALSEVTDGGFDLSVEVYVEEQPEQQGSDDEGGGWYSHDWPGHDCDWHDGVWNKLDWDRIDPGGCYGEGSDAAEDPIEVGQAVRHVQLADGSKVFDAQPKEVGAEDIAVTNYLEAEGFPPTMDGDPDVNAFIVMLNHEVVVVAGVPTPTIVSESEERLIGEITSYGSGFVYVVTNANNAGDPWCVAYTSDTNIIEIYTDPDGVKVEQVLAPTIVGSQRFFDARGEMGSPCFDATSLVIDAVPFK
jgi:hypothetical protein